jgi:hypothetical protein
MALKNLFNRARHYANSPEGRRLISQGKDALRQRGTKGRGAQGGHRQSGSSGLIGMAERFLGRGGPSGTTRRS